MVLGAAAGERCALPSPAGPTHCARSGNVAGHVMQRGIWLSQYSDALDHFFGARWAEPYGPSVVRALSVAKGGLVFNTYDPACRGVIMLDDAEQFMHIGPKGRRHANIGEYLSQLFGQRSGRDARRTFVFSNRCVSPAAQGQIKRGARMCVPSQWLRSDVRLDFGTRR